MLVASGIRLFRCEYEQSRLHVHNTVEFVGKVYIKAKHDNAKQKQHQKPKPNMFVLVSENVVFEEITDHVNGRQFRFVLFQVPCWWWGEGDLCLLGDGKHVVW